MDKQQIADFTQQAVSDDRCSKSFALEVENRLLAKQEKIEALESVIAALQLGLDDARKDATTSVLAAKWLYVQLDDADLEAIAMRAWPWLDPEDQP